MKYKTVIEITSEANDKNEAVDIAGEYLSGNISSGVKMNCATHPLHYYSVKVVGVAAVMLLLIVGSLSISYLKPSGTSAQSFTPISAIQPPLKTSIEDKKNADFKKEWNSKQSKEILDYIKK